MESSKPTVLVVDDDRDIVQLYELHLAAAHFITLTAFDGQEALRLLNSKGSGIDVIVSDIVMPNLDGYGLCEKVRTQSEASDTPFIFVSALQTLDEKLKGYEVGGDDYITKPVEFKELIEKIHRLLTIREQNRSLNKQLAESYSTAMQAMTYSSELGQIIEFFKNSVNTATLEEIAALVFEYMKTHQLNSVMQFHTASGIINFSDKGKVAPLESNVIELSRPKSRFFDFGARTIINYDDFSVLIKNMPMENPDKYGTLKDTLGTLCEVIAERVKAILLNDSINRKEKILGTVNSTINDIGDTLSAVQKANVLAIEQMIAEIDDAMMTLGLTEHQEQNIRAIAARCLTRVDRNFEHVIELDEKFGGIRNTLVSILERKDAVS